jgi:hypothetical protein
MKIGDMVRIPATSICDECVSLMVGIIAADHPDWRSAQIEKLQRLATPARG